MVGCSVQTVAVAVWLQSSAPTDAAAIVKLHTIFLWAAGATLFSFVAALCFFLLELFVYQTVGWKSALQPLIVAGESLLKSVLPLGWQTLDVYCIVQVFLPSGWVLDGITIPLCPLTQSKPYDVTYG